MNVLLRILLSVKCMYGYGYKYIHYINYTGLWVVEWISNTILFKTKTVTQ